MSTKNQPLSLEQEAALLVAKRHQQRFHEHALNCRLEEFTNAEVLSLAKAGAISPVMGGWVITGIGHRSLRTGVLG